MIPREKKMVAHFDNRPFTFIGIDSDGDRSVLRKAMKKTGITWRNVVGGQRDGAIFRRWNIQGFPTIYVLDANGVIRQRLLGDGPFEKTVEELVREVEGK